MSGVVEHQLVRVFLITKGARSTKVFSESKNRALHSIFEFRDLNVVVEDRSRLDSDKLIKNGICNLFMDSLSVPIPNQKAPARRIPKDMEQAADPSRHATNEPIRQFIEFSLAG